MLHLLDLRNYRDSNHLQFPVQLHIDGKSRLGPKLGMPDAVEPKAELLAIDHQQAGRSAWFAQHFAANSHDSSLF